MNIIEITESNYQAYTGLDQVAFSFAYEGAMGEHGGIYIIDRAGQIYHANYLLGDDSIDRAHLNAIIPIFDELEFRLFGCETRNANWQSVDLGFGNTLFIISDISEGFHTILQRADFQRPGQLFQHWPGIVLTLLGKTPSDLTMSDIWAVHAK